MKLDELEQQTGVTFFDYQYESLTRAADQPEFQRLCLYYRTGAGKSITALAALRLWGHDQALVIAPPSTHKSWTETATRFGVSVTCISHAKFRMTSYQLNRNMAVIADEFHMFGGHKGQGWKKLERLSKGLQAPLVLASATPNYNDAERVYCIQRILDPVGSKGGYLDFIYRHCTTEQNPFGMEPIVTGFHRFADAAEFLASLPKVEYLPDELVYTINDITIPEMTDQGFETYGYDRRRHRMIASQIEERHARINHNLVDPDGWIWEHVYDELIQIAGAATTPLLVYANHSTVAEALSLSLATQGVRHGLITGKTTKTDKQSILDRFTNGELDVLVGTASLATGTDGLDKVCDLLVILDDTEDDSLRRQLIGRIMPRGADADASKKQVYRLLF